MTRSGCFARPAARARPITPRVRASDLLVARNLAVAGVGFAILPTRTAREEVAKGQLIRVLPKWQIPPLTPAATYIERRYMPMRIRAFLDTVADEFAGTAAAL